MRGRKAISSLSTFSPFGLEVNTRRSAQPPCSVAQNRAVNLRFLSLPYLDVRCTPRAEKSGQIGWERPSSRAEHTRRSCKRWCRHAVAREKQESVRQKKIGIILSYGKRACFGGDGGSSFLCVPRVIETADMLTTQLSFQWVLAVTRAFGMSFIRFRSYRVKHTPSSTRFRR